MDAPPNPENQPAGPVMVPRDGDPEAAGKAAGAAGTAGTAGTAGVEGSERAEGAPGRQPLEGTEPLGAGAGAAVLPDVQPLDVDGTRTVLVGTLLWAAAFVVLLPFWGTLADQGRLWWLWTCLAGVALGACGWEHCRRRARRRRAAS